jgi:hypothetical protein
MGYNRVEIETGQSKSVDLTRASFAIFPRVPRQGDQYPDVKGFPQLRGLISKARSRIRKLWLGDRHGDATNTRSRKHIGGPDGGRRQF